MILDPTSMQNTVDNVNELYMLGKEIPAVDKLDVARWIATQQGKKGCYRQLFAPTQTDFEQGMRLFTGERLVSASARHIMGQEAARAVWLLGKDDPQVRESYDKATAWMRQNPEFALTGSFCCGRCSLAYWRHYWIGDFGNKEELLAKGLLSMKDYRTGAGEWRRFPFYYSIYTLKDIDLDPAIDELRYARPLMEQHLKNIRKGIYAARRVNILEKALARIN